MNDAVQRVLAYLREKKRQVFGPDLTRRGGDVETIHRMRVASRRLRVGLQFYSVLFPATELRQIRRQLRRVTRALGAVRACDVNMRLLRASRQPHRQPLLHALLAERAGHFAAAVEVLQLLRTSHLPERIDALLAQPARMVDEKRLLEVAREQLRHRRRVVRRRFDDYQQRGSTAAFHRLRIAAKKYRYALEASQVAFCGNAAKRIAAVEKLQDLMGQCHDVEVLLEWLAGLRDKKLASVAAPLIDFFKAEHERRFAAVEKFLQRNRQWLRKVKLRRQ